MPEASLRALTLPFTPRFIVFTSCILLAVLSLGLVIAHPDWLVGLGIPTAAFALLAAIGVRDLVQKRHAILRNYPIAAHLRFLLEEIRPEMRQYFFESEKDGTAVQPRQARRRLSARQAGARQAALRHAIRRLCRRLRMDAPFDRAEARRRRRRSASTIGGPDCTQPYSASVFNISAMSFGALSPTPSAL